MQPGDVVAAGDRLAVVEAMKMEIAINAPLAGRVGDVFVARNVQVDAGAPLVRIEPAASSDDGGRGNGNQDRARRPRGGCCVPTARSGRDTAIVHARLRRTAARREARRVGALRGCGGRSRSRGTDLFADLWSLVPERRDPEGDEVSGPREHLNNYLRSLDTEREGVPDWFAERLRRALAHYRVDDLTQCDELQDALMRIFIAQQRRADQAAVVFALLEDRLAGRAHPADPPTRLRETLDRVIESTQRRHPAVAGMARGVRHRLFDRPLIEHHRDEVSAEMRDRILTLVGDGDDAGAAFGDLVACPMPLHAGDDRRRPAGDHGEPRTAPARHDEPVLQDPRDRERTRPSGRATSTSPALSTATTTARWRCMSARARPDELESVFDAFAVAGAFVTLPDTAVIDLYLSLAVGDRPTADELSERVRMRLDTVELPGSIRRVAVVASHPAPDSTPQLLTFRRAGDEGIQPYWMPADDFVGLRTDRFTEDVKFRGLHPMIARRLQMWRLENFEISRLPSIDDVYAFDCVARDNATDRRLIAVAEVREITPVHRRRRGRRQPARRRARARRVSRCDPQRALGRPDRQRLEWNRVMLYVWPVIELPLAEVSAIARRLAPLTEGLGLEQVVVSGRLLLEGSTEPVEAVMRLGFEPGHGLTVRITPPPTAPMLPLDDLTRKRIQTRRRGLVYAYELAPMLAGPGGTFTEYDLDDDGSLRPIERAPGENKAGVVVGVVSSPARHEPPDDDAVVTRVAILGDATKAMGAITEAECLRILGAIDLAASMDVPVEWFALSAGAKIAMDSGSENLDWVARVLRRLVEHTQAGGEVNVVVAGINVGAQPYWNAEATMLMHTNGILVMTPDSAMVLTGKQAIDYSGGVSAEDNLGIGGYSRIMGPNGEAQYFAPTIAAACELLRDHYRLSYRAPGERWPRRVATSDPFDRDVRGEPHQVDGSEFKTVGDIFSDTANRGPQEALRHPNGDRRGDRRRSRAARALAGDGRGRHGRRLRRPARRERRDGHRDRVATTPPPRGDAGRRPGAVVGRHAVPAVVEEGGAGDQRRQRRPAGGDAREPVGLRRVARVLAPAAAGVRRRDRPVVRQLRRALRALRDLALPRWGVRRVLGNLERRHGGAGGRGIVRIGDRRGARRRGGLHPRRR